MLSAKKELFTSAGGGYQISRSVRLRSSASAYFNRTFTTPTNAARWTFNRWVKRGTIGARQSLFAAGTSGSSYANIEFKADDTIQFLSENSAVQFQLVTTQVFRDPSAWYNIHIIYDSANATSTDRIQLWINGVRVTSFSTATYPTTTPNNLFNTAIAHQIGVLGYGSVAYFDGYQTELNFIDGQALTPSSFGETNAITGVWQPKKYAGTYGTNGFYLNFSDNSAVTTSSNVGIGKDFSGNGNYWTSNSISVTAGATYDSMLDVPTPYADGGNGRGNYAVLSPVNPTANTPSDGNLRGVMGSSENGITSTMAIPSGMSAYWEVSSASTTSASIGCYAGVASLGVSMAQSASYNKTGVWAMIAVNIRQLYANGSAGSSVASTLASTSILQVAVDNTSSGSNTYIWIGVDNVFYNSTMGTTGNPSTGANPTFTISKQDLNAFFSGYLNTVYANFGQRPFAYTPPTGFVALNTQNLPTPTISNGANYMAATLYTGTGASQTIANTVNGVSFQPDWVWVKSRSAATDHALYDAVRGVQKQLESNTTTAETTETTGLTAFGSTGFTVGALAQMNTSAATYVAWQWNAGGSTVTNTSGSISAQVRANTTAGFSVVTYTGNGTSGATVGHGLGVAPAMMILKLRNSTENWPVYHKNQNASPANGCTYLSLTNAYAAFTGIFNNTVPTSSVFTLGNNAQTNGNTNTYIAYCFAAVAGYSAFGSYTGNGSADGPFVYLGFRPRFVLIKSATSAENWWLLDSARSANNVASLYLHPNTTNADQSVATMDFLSNGFKLRYNGAAVNASGATLIYAAFAENPFKLSLAR